MNTFAHRLVRDTATVIATCAGLAFAAPAAWAVPTPPAAQQVWRSIETPYDPAAIFHTDSIAFNQFTTNADLTAFDPISVVPESEGWALALAGLAAAAAIKQRVSYKAD